MIFIDPEFNHQFRAISSRICLEESLMLDAMIDDKNLGF